MPADTQALPLADLPQVKPQPAFHFKDDIPRERSFSLGDFHDFDRCVFRFFVNHHLGKKYELAEGNPNQTIGTLLDLTMKKIHQSTAYDQPVEYLENLVKAAESDVRSDVASRGKNSFYGAHLDFLTGDVIQTAKDVLRSYHQGLQGKYRHQLLTPTTKKVKPFWKKVLPGAELVQLWGGPDAIEQGSDGIPEVADYKYMENLEKGVGNLDMDLMPKIYILLTAGELIDLGFKKVRFVIRLWQDPGNDSLYEEFDLSQKESLEIYFRDKIDKILRTTCLTFCDKSFCKPCQSPLRPQWITELKLRGMIKELPEQFTDQAEAAPDLPF